MKKVAAACVAAACPAVYEEDDQYIIVGKAEADSAVPQEVADDETVIRLKKELLGEIKD